MNTKNCKYLLGLLETSQERKVLALESASQTSALAGAQELGQLGPETSKV